MHVVGRHASPMPLVKQRSPQLPDIQALVGRDFNRQINNQPLARPRRDRSSPECRRPSVQAVFECGHRPASARDTPKRRHHINLKVGRPPEICATCASCASIRPVNVEGVSEISKHEVTTEENPPAPKSPPAERLHSLHRLHISPHGGNASELAARPGRHHPASGLQRGSRGEVHKRLEDPEALSSSGRSAELIIRRATARGVLPNTGCPYCRSNSRPDQGGSSEARDNRVHLVGVDGIPVPCAAEPGHHFPRRAALIRTDTADTDQVRGGPMSRTKASIRASTCCAFPETAPQPACPPPSRLGPLSRAVGKENGCGCPCGNPRRPIVRPGVAHDRRLPFVRSRSPVSRNRLLGKVLGKLGQGSANRLQFAP